MYADNLEHPRWLHVLPNGDVLVAETNAPERPLREELRGIKGWVVGKVMKVAGADAPSADRITLPRDADGDGRAETRSVCVENLNSPFGRALVGNALYIANTDALVKVPYEVIYVPFDGGKPSGFIGPDGNAFGGRRLGRQARPAAGGRRRRQRDLARRRRAGAQRRAEQGGSTPRSFGEHPKAGSLQ